MLTPQEVSEFSFPKASLGGGYNMASVDDFLDQLTEDYTALYKENASLKSKMKVLSDSLEEYRVTEKGMRRALLAAQQEADEMVSDAEKKRDELLTSAEAEAKETVEKLRHQTVEEQEHLETARKSTADYIELVRQAMEKHKQSLDQLEEVVSVGQPEVTVEASSVEVDDAVQDIEASINRLIDTPEETPQQENVGFESGSSPDQGNDSSSFQNSPEGETPSHRAQERSASFEDDIPDDNADSDSSPTRRIDFDNLQFGSNYDNKGI